MKIKTCALVMINDDGDILGCHGTGKSKENGYDFPKGCHDEADEDDLATALRELREETGIILCDKKDVIDAGIHNHNFKKDIHIFICKVKEFPDINTLKCTTYFEDENGNMLPEMDGYRIIKKEERKKYFYQVLQNKFELIDKLNNNGNN